MQPQKILIIRNDKIGDLIFSSGVFREIKKELPSAIIDVVASPENIPIIENNKNINKIYPLRYSPRTLKEFYNYFLISRKIKKENYDIGIEMRGSVFNTLLLFLSGIKKRFGYYNHPWSKKFLNFPIERDLTKHETLLQLELINKSLGINAKDSWPEIAVDGKDIEGATSFIKKNKLTKFICISPEANLPRRQWPLENFVSIINFLKKKYPHYKILIVGQRTEKVNWILKQCPFCIPLVDLSLREVYLVLKKSNLCIVVDGAPHHLAWSSKTNVISIMSKYLVKVVGSLGKNSILIAGGTDHIDANDLYKVSIKEVEKKINKVLKKS
ncbi:MAG: glycosyltransferase family 9 protein [Candidatus Pacearchaeota archaeon]